MKRLSFLALVQHLLRCDYLIFVVRETILGIDASIGFNCEVCTQRSLFIFLTNLRFDDAFEQWHMFLLLIFSAVTHNFGGVKTLLVFGVCSLSLKMSQFPTQVAWEFS